MAILARILMLVACVPLLQPPGFCVCKAAGPGRTSPSQEGPAQTNSPLAPKKGCCSQRAAKESVTSPTTESPAPIPHPCPSPADDDHHMPGCPASVGVDRFKWVEPAQTFSDALPPVEATAYLPFEVAALAARPILTSMHRPSAPPLYLSHCSLVI